MKNCYVIGICGGSGSGKTYFVRELRKQFSAEEVAILSQDDYYLPIEKQKKDALGIHNFDLPGGINKKGMKKDLEKLLGGEPIELPEYNFNNRDAAPMMKVIHPAPVVIVEGLFVFHFKKIAAHFDLSLFIHAKDPHKIARRILRDQKERNYPLDDVLYRYQAHVMPSYDRYIGPYSEQADLVVNNNYNFEKALAVICGFIRVKLPQMGRNSEIV
jgi:uridine kinase